MIRARAWGRGVVFITHNVLRALPTGEHLLILSRGRTAGEYRRAELNEATLNRLMDGDVEFEAPQKELATLNARLERADVAG